MGSASPCRHRLTMCPNIFNADAPPEGSRCAARGAPAAPSTDAWAGAALPEIAAMKLLAPRTDASLLSLFSRATKKLLPPRADTSLLILFSLAALKLLAPLKTPAL